MKSLNAKRCTLNAQKGFTLIESIIYIAIIGAVLAAFVNFILAVSASRNKSYAEQEVNANMRTALSVISHKIKSASGVNLGASTFGTNSGVLSLAMVSTTFNPTIISVATGTLRLQITEGAGAVQYLTSERVRVTNLMFTNLTGSSTQSNIGIDFTISYASSSDANFNFTKSWQTSVSTRR